MIAACRELQAQAHEYRLCLDQRSLHAQIGAELPIAILLLSHEADDTKFDHIWCINSNFVKCQFNWVTFKCTVTYESE